MICCSSCPSLGLSASQRSSPARWLLRPCGRAGGRVGCPRRRAFAAVLHSSVPVGRRRRPRPCPQKAVLLAAARRGECPPARRGTCLESRFRPRPMSCGRKAARRTLRASREIVTFLNDLRWEGRTLDVPLERPWRVAMRPATGWLGRGSHLQRCAGRSPRAQKPRGNDLLTR